jgi:hypothetical protein
MSETNDKKINYKILISDSFLTEEQPITKEIAFKEEKIEVPVTHKVDIKPEIKTRADSKKEIKDSKKEILKETEIKGGLGYFKEEKEKKETNVQQEFFYSETPAAYQVGAFPGGTIEIGYSLKEPTTETPVSYGSFKTQDQYLVGQETTQAISTPQSKILSQELLAGEEISVPTFDTKKQIFNWKFIFSIFSVILIISVFIIIKPYERIKQFLSKNKEQVAIKPTQPQPSQELQFPQPIQPQPSQPTTSSIQFPQPIIQTTTPQPSQPQPSPELQFPSTTSSISSTQPIIQTITPQTPQPSKPQPTQPQPSPELQFPQPIQPQPSQPTTSSIQFPQPIIQTTTPQPSQELQFPQQPQFPQPIIQTTTPQQPQQTQPSQPQQSPKLLTQLTTINLDNLEFLKNITIKKINLNNLDFESWEKEFKKFLNYQEFAGTKLNLNFLYNNNRISNKAILDYFIKPTKINSKTKEKFYQNLGDNYAFLVYYGYTRKYLILIFEIKNKENILAFNKEWENKNMNEDLQTLFLDFKPLISKKTFVTKTYKNYSYRILDFGDNFKIIWSLIDNYLIYSTTERGLKEIIDLL